MVEGLWMRPPTKGDTLPKAAGRGVFGALR